MSEREYRLHLIRRLHVHGFRHPHISTVTTEQLEHEVTLLDSLVPIPQGAR